MNRKSKLNKISIILIFTFVFQLQILNIVSAIDQYPPTNSSGKPLNKAMSDIAGFGIYGLEDNGTGVKTGVIPSGMTVPQEQKSGEWRYLGYNFANAVISNPSFPGDYSGPGGTKIGAKAYTWTGIGINDYSRITPATNADSGDTQSANAIGIDYCELLEAATEDKPGAFRVWFKVPPYPGYPNGRTMYMTYSIPKNDIINRFSYVYFREEGTQSSLLSAGQLYEKYNYPLRPSQSVDVSWTAKNFSGYEFTRSITGTNTSGGFTNEVTGESGKTRQGTLSYTSSNEFDVIFYYKKIVPTKLLKVRHVYYDPLTNTEISDLNEHNTPINQGETVTESAQTLPGYKFLKYQHSNDGFYSGETSTNTQFSINYNDIPYDLHYIRFLYIKDDSSLMGQISTDKASYACKNTDVNVTIQAKEQTDLFISDATAVSEIGAKVINYSLNNGAEIHINSIKTGSNIKAIATDYFPINLNVSSLKDGTNTVTFKGYSWWKDNQGNIKEVNTTKTITVTKAAISKPIATIEAPTSTHVGNTVTVKGSGSDPSGLPIVDYLWTCSNGQALSATGGDIKVNNPVTLTLKVKNSANIWSDTVTHTINIENNNPTAKIFVPNTVFLGDDIHLVGYGQDPDGDKLEYYWYLPNDMYGSMEGQSGDIYFMDLGQKYFELTVADPSGATGYATAQTNVIAPYPSPNIQTKGTLKENRKVILDGSDSTGGSKRVGLDWTKAKWEIVTVFGGTSTDIKTNSSYNGTQTIEVLFKKPGIYKARLTLTNTLGLSSTQEKTFEIIEDKAPSADFSLVQNIIRDPQNPSSSGLYQGTFKVTDISKSEDNDTIVKRAYFVTFDSDNDGDYDEETCYIYDLDYTSIKQMPFNDSDNLHWRAMGIYRDFKTFNIDNINTGNLGEIMFDTTHVGKYLFDVIVKEEFGQETIQEFTTIADRKTGDTY